MKKENEINLFDLNNIDDLPIKVKGTKNTYEKII